MKIGKRETEIRGKTKNGIRNSDNGQPDIRFAIINLDLRFRFYDFRYPSLGGLFVFQGIGYTHSLVVSPSGIHPLSP